MSVLLSCLNVSKVMTHKTLFRDLNLAIEDGERLGIIGPNGAGKSTLLKILLGEETCDTGQVARRKQLKVASVSQQQRFDLEKTIEEVLIEAGQGQGMSWEQAHLATHKLLSRFGFDNPMQAVKELSGGWKKRLAIACALVHEPDLVFFDEPTNHLDLRSVLWLEEFLNQAQFAWVLVSHDRYFLDRVTRRILEIHPVYPSGWRIDLGNYSEFMDKRFVYLQNLQSEQQSLANRLRREEDWLVRQPKARGTKAKYRVDEAFRMKDEMQDMRQRLSQSSSDIDFQSSGRKSKQLMELKEVSQRFGTRALFEGLNMVLRPGMVLGVLGDNGTGKSTLLKILAGQIQPTEGSVSQVPQLEMVYFDQGREALQGDWTLKRAFSDGQDNVIFQDRPIHVASWARRFQFQVEQLDQPLSMLSGGEQAKVMIARLMLRKADVLLLDEPNNDLDIDTLEILEERLEDFPGAIVVVSHDRYLLDKLCTSYLGLLPGGGIEAYASYEQWERTLKEDGRSSTKKDKLAPAPATRARAPKAGKLSYNEQREYDAMEEAILLAETELAEAQEKLEEVAGLGDGQVLLQASQHMQHLQDKVDRLYARWTELETKLSGGAQ